MQDEDTPTNVAAPKTRDQYQALEMMYAHLLVVQHVTCEFLKKPREKKHIPSHMT